MIFHDPEYSVWALSFILAPGAVTIAQPCTLKKKKKQPLEVTIICLLIYWGRGMHSTVHAFRQEDNLEEFVVSSTM